MEWAVCTASSDSEDGTTQEMNEEEGAPSNRDQQDSRYGAGEQSSTKDAHGSVDLTFNEVFSTRNSCYSIDPAEAGKKPSGKGSPDLIHFGKKQGIKRSAPDSMGSTCMVNISEGAGIRDREPENITMQMVTEEGDEEQELEDLGEWAEELEFDSSNSMKGVHQKLKPRRSETQRKKRNLTEDGLGQASKLVKRSAHPPENQMPCASAECGESASNPSCSQWNESFQSEHLEGNYAAEEPVNCTESKGASSHSSELVEHQEVQFGKVKYRCTECYITFMTAEHLNGHLKEHKPFQCPECNKLFGTADGMSRHRLAVHKVKKPFQCTECNLTIRSALLRNMHCLAVHGIEKSFRCPECNKCYVTEQGMGTHWLTNHNVAKTHNVAKSERQVSRLKYTLF